MPPLCDLCWRSGLAVRDRESNRRQDSTGCACGKGPDSRSDSIGLGRPCFPAFQTSAQLVPCLPHDV